MEKSIISEGKTTNEAIEKGLKELKVTKEMVDIKVLENEDKRSFFSILTPRIVKVEITIKEQKENSKTKTTKVSKDTKTRTEIHLSEEEQQKAEDNLKEFLNQLLKDLPKDTKYEIKKEEKGLQLNINGDNIGYLIGYRGETLYAMQNIISSIAGKGINNRVRVILDIGGYKEKRKKTLEELALKVAKTVIKNGKTVILEPMQAYERKIIHSKLQKNDKIETSSIGEEPYRKVVISIKK